MKKVLCIVETAYRATQEEQDDAALWFIHALRKAGSEVNVLLTGNAVSYAVTGQKPEGLIIGDTPIERPPHPDGDLQTMVRDGIDVFTVREDAVERGIAPGRLLRSCESIGRDGLPALFAGYDQIWHW